MNTVKAEQKKLNLKAKPEGIDLPLFLTIESLIIEGMNEAHKGGGVNIQLTAHNITVDIYKLFKQRLK